MTDNILRRLPARQGHFLLESGYHTDLWFNLDALFLDPEDLRPGVSALVELLKPYDISAVCGPLLGGAFLAHAIANEMGVRFYYTQQVNTETGDTLYSASYRLPAKLSSRVGAERVAIVDDMISAGSSVRATAAELMRYGAQVAAVASLVLLGRQADNYFSNLGIPVVALAREDFNLWTPVECRLCKTGTALENPSVE